MNIWLCAELSAVDQAEWLTALSTALPGHHVFADRSAVAPQDIEVAIVANPPAGSLQGLPNLRLIQSLWAGVDRLLADTSLPAGVPLARMVDPAMNQAMAQTALWATLALHRGFFDYQAQQAALQWRQLPQSRADEHPVLVLGAGQMGQATAQALVHLGYPVTLWRRGAAQADKAKSPGADQSQTLPPAPRFHQVQGQAALHAQLAQARVVINLLPLTPNTRGLIDADFLLRLPVGAGLVNLARGAHVVDADLLAALDAGHLGRAVLDVFNTEPLPSAHAYWRHPRVSLLPHAAAATDLRSAAAVAARNVVALATGQPLQNLILPDRGY